MTQVVTSFDLPNHPDERNVFIQNIRYKAYLSPTNSVGVKLSQRSIPPRLISLAIQPRKLPLLFRGHSHGSLHGLCLGGLPLCLVLALHLLLLLLLICIH
jgi:hypothetical protein